MPKTKKHQITFYCSKRFSFCKNYFFFTYRRMQKLLKSCIFENSFKISTYLYFLEKNIFLSIIIKDET